MCSIFGFIARGNSKPSPDTLATIIRANIARGPHSFGMAWLDEAGRMHCYKQCGRFTDHMGVLAMAREAKMLIGHLRFATHGSAEHNINNHPHPADGGWIVHNGIVRNYVDLIRDCRLWPVSECDSEVLGLLIERTQAKTLLRRCAGAVESTEGGLAMMGLWSRTSAGGSLIVARRGNPLHLADTPDGVYLATLSTGLPGKVSALRDDTIRVYVRDGRAIKCSATELEQELPERVAGGLFEEEGNYRGG